MSAERVSIVGMIYKSIPYLDFMVDQLRRRCSSSVHRVTPYIVANDPTPQVLSRLQSLGVDHAVYRDPAPSDYYLNRVYRAWNYGGNTAPGDILVFINSDMAFSEGWLDNLLRRLTPDTLPCSRLVESGKLLSGQHAVSKNFGRSPGTFDAGAFDAFAATLSEDRVSPGGLFMPCALRKRDFVDSGGYPEGNITVLGVGKYPSPVVCSGDHFFFYSTLASKRHITVFDSVVYHIQEGEKDA